MAPFFTGVARGFFKGAAEVGGGAAALSASGGTTYTPGNGYKYHVFNYPNSSPFDVTGTGNVEVLIVAGGGASAESYHAGAGGGGVVWHKLFPVTTGPYTVTIGAGGLDPRGNGGDSTFGGMTAKGGGGAGGYYTGGGKAGGNGGGEQDVGQGIGPGTQPAQNTPFTPNPNFAQYGNPGGAGTQTGAYAAAGGGGAGEPAPPPSGPGPGAGGRGGHGIAIPGFEYPLVGMSPYTPIANSPTNNQYGAGGGGWGYSTQNSGLRPQGGGGRGGNGVPSPQSDGLDGLGGGGGNSYYDAGTNAGGDGVVIVRYLL
jgi:hypothetical protein